MDEKKEAMRPANPRRRKPSKSKVFREVYLPVVIAGIALILIIYMIGGSITRSFQKRKVLQEASIAASIKQSQEDARLEQECQDILLQADALARGYDYQGAIALLDSFSGNLHDYPQLSTQRDTYDAIQKSMVPWDDPSKVMNLSFQLLVADPARAYKHEVYANSFRTNFITTTEFSRILQQLYENGYILVRLDDIIAKEEAADGTITYKAKTLYLPEGKKPLMLTQTNTNYNLYLIDSDKDMVPDQNGGGFASKLLLDSNGRFTNEMVDASGQTVTGAYDMVPILEEFVEKHPDFSYKGAKAILSLTGYNGLFGYRTHPAGKEKFGEDAYNQAVADVQQLAAALQDRGYTLASYTYENIPYGESGISVIQKDLEAWNNEVVPILGTLDILVYAQNSDISSDEAYSGEKFTTLTNAGFRYFLGFCKDGKQKTLVADSYVRQGRILVTGGNLTGHSDWFTPYFDASSVLDEARNSQSTEETKPTEG